MRLSRSSRAALAALAALAPTTLLAQQGPKSETGGFVVRLGADTMVVERYVRTPDRLEAWSVNRQPATISRHLVVTFANGNPVKMEYEGGRADGSQPQNKVVMLVGTGDTAQVTITRNGRDTTMVVPGAANAIPAVANSFALSEVAIARFLGQKADSTTITTLPIGAPAGQRQSIKRVAKNTLHWDYFGNPWIVTLDGKGRITAVDGARSASKISVARVKDVDVAALTQEYVRRDEAGQGFGVASRADSVKATIGNASLAVNYSRPARRGRALMGNLIPVGEVWRTGANAATLFSTSADVVIGGTTVPAGKYTLWTLPTKDGWQLIVNKQTGQWGTAYDASQDLVRIPMTVDKAAAGGPELFTIAIEPAGTGAAGTLRLTWGDVAVSVPVVAKTSTASN